MPVPVPTYLISAFWAAGLLAAFPASVGSHSSDKTSSSDLSAKEGQQAPAHHFASRTTLPPPPRTKTAHQRSSSPSSWHLPPPSRPNRQQQVLSLNKNKKPPLKKAPKATKSRKAPKALVPTRYIPPKKPSPSGYTRSVRKMIRAHNKNGQPRGDIKLYARENRWGSGVKIQSCYGDNILTRFSVTRKGQTGAVWFQFKNVTYRNRGRHRHKWIMVKPGMLIRGRRILLRAQASHGNDVVTLRVVGNCIERPQQ